MMHFEHILTNGSKLPKIIGKLLSFCLLQGHKKAKKPLPAEICRKGDKTTDRAVFFGKNQMFSATAAAA